MGLLQQQVLGRAFGILTRWDTTLVGVQDPEIHYGRSEGGSKKGRSLRRLLATGNHETRILKRYWKPPPLPQGIKMRAPGVGGVYLLLPSVCRAPEGTALDLLFDHIPSQKCRGKPSGVTMASVPIDGSFSL